MYHHLEDKEDVKIANPMTARFEPKSWVGNEQVGSMWYVTK